jgi:N4-gp56 family major capsid protein
MAFRPEGKAFNEYGTMLSGLIDPQVLGEFIDYKMMDAIKFAPLCNVNRDLEGRPGSKLTLPKWSWIGLAEDVPEGTDVPTAKLEAEPTEVPIKKAGKGVYISDESILSAYGNPVDEVAKQLLMAVAGKVDNDCVAAFREATKQVPNVTPEDFDKYVIADMIAEFGEDIEEEMVVIIHPEQLAALRKDKDFINVMNGEKIISGEMGQIFGCRVVVSNKCHHKDDEKGIDEKNIFLVKNGAVEILMKRNVMIEADRDISNKTNLYVVDQHYGVYLRDESKIVKATIKK